jgi:hypothetical protein
MKILVSLLIEDEDISDSFELPFLFTVIASWYRHQHGCGCYCGCRCDHHHHPSSCGQRKVIRDLLGHAS